jgi:CPA1 family monovalent cation:H+ antiporter
VDELEFVILLLLAAAALVRIADVVAIPYPIVLVLAGLAIGLIPALPDATLPPEVFFLVFLPPLVHAAGYASSPRELRAELGSLGVLAVGLVLLTMGAVAVIAHEAAGISWEAAFVLGAVVAPTDPVSAAATFSRLGVPHRVRLLVEGEAMVNDGFALVAYSVAVAAAVSGMFSAGEAALDFVGAAVGGTAIGLAAGWVEVRVLQRQHDVPLSIFLTIGFAYSAYILAEEVGASGVLATVVAGLYLGWNNHRAFDADMRLSAVSFWETFVFSLNAMLFVLLGLQFPDLIDELEAEIVSIGDLLGAAALTSAAVIAVRMATVFTPFAIPAMPWRERIVVGWSGMRGAISLAAALSVPLAVADRPQILFFTFVVILVTLVGQGLTLPGLMRALRVRGAESWTPDHAIARLETAQAALDRLDELEEEEGADPEQVRRLRELYRARYRQCVAVLGGEGDGVPSEEEPPQRFSKLRRDLITTERATLLRLRNDGALKLETMREIERDLDLDEARLR